MQAFEAFKDTNDERLTQIERRSAARRGDERQARPHRPRAGRNQAHHRRDRAEGGASGDRRRAAQSGASLAHKSAFDGYVRKGETGNLKDLEAKALSVGSDPDGGYLVPDETERTVNTALKDISPIRAIAGIRQVSGSVYKKPFAITGAATGWVGETAARPQTNAPTLAELAFPTMELYAMPAATQSAPRRQRRRYRRVARRRGAGRVCRAGGRSVRHRRRHQQAEGLPRLHHGGQRVVDVGQHRLHRQRVRRARFRRPIPATS